MTINTTDQLVAVHERSNALRIGTVSAVGATTLTVNVAGTPIQSAYLASYDAAEGDLVAIMRQDSTWLTLGRLAGSGPNSVANPSFEDDGAADGTPSFWGLYNQTGTSTLSTIGDEDAPDGQYVLLVSPAASSRTAVTYSNPIEVLPGQVYSVSAYVAGVQDSGVPTGDATLEAWFNVNETDVPPTTVATTTIATMLNVPNSPPYFQLAGTVAVPTGVGYMRIGLRSVMAANVGMKWDFVTARLISGGSGA